MPNEIIFLACSNLFSIMYCFGAFHNYDNLTSVIIPDSVTSIGDSAFAGCHGLTIYCEFASKPSGWSSNWNAIDYTDTNKLLNSFHPVYWAGQWTYDTQSQQRARCVTKQSAPT